MTQPANTIGERIRERRKALGLSQERLGERLDPKMSQAQVAKWERRQRLDADLLRVRQLADALDTSPQYLLGLDEAA